MKISIIGMPGSGKTTLASKISEKLQIPHIHLDRFWFEAGGIKGNPETVSDSIKKQIETAMKEISWVSDGLYSKYQSQIANKADIVLFLDIPLWKRLLNHLARITNRANRHPELSLLDELVFFVEIVKREFTKKPKLMNLVKKFKEKVVTLRNRYEIELYLKGL